MRRLRTWWRKVTGLAMAEDAGYTKGWLEGFNAGLQTNMRASGRGAQYMRGFVEGRESVRTHPLDVAIDEEGEASCTH